MQRVIIREQDLTTNGMADEITDVVFVPGFSNATGDDAAKPMIPTLCTSMEEFNAYFGGDAPTFSEDQFYPVAGSSTYGFGALALPKTEGVGEEGDIPWMSAGSPDPSYVYAKELVSAGLPVMYMRINGGEKSEYEGETYGISVEDMYTALKDDVYHSERSPLINKENSVKYITSGGYPIFEYGLGTQLTVITSQMCFLAMSRGDCVALVDHTNNPSRDLVGDNSVYYAITQTYPITSVNDQDTFATMFTPWGCYSTSQNYGGMTSEAEMPGSFAYLASLAKSIKTNANWLAIAGASRGLVPGLKYLHTDKVLTNNIAESYQNDLGVSLNAITNIRPYGLCIWGNRTLQVRSVSRMGFATSFLNLRNLVSDVKKQAFLAAQSLMFEQNSDVLWVNFKSMMTPLLDQMVSGYGVSGYKIVKVPTTDKTKLNAVIRLYPIYPVEKFEIGIVLTDDDTITVEEGE